MRKLIINTLLTILLIGCETLTYHAPKKNISLIMLLDPSSDIYAYINLSKNRFIYDELNFKYKIGLHTIGNLYLSYTKNSETFSLIVTGNFPKNIFWGIQNNSNFESQGNIFTNPKWKIKNSNIYIKPTKNKKGILINQKETTNENENILTTKYIDIIDRNEMFIWINDITKLIPNNIKKTNMIPFNKGILIANGDKNENDYNLKSYLNTNNPEILSILLKKLMPTILKNTTKIIVSSPIKSRIKDQNTLELRFNVSKISVKKFITSLILNKNQGMQVSELNNQFSRRVNI
ncbi:hypothetical protein BmHG_00856 [Borrelia miyamotoi]|uniref:Lipoprotein n=1 Tax=Borrelia miyamotoi TaxID=47466 RepID=A0AAP8YTE6_9SPIR|nr:hypothetical protein [Borrelia miyamotoi]AHH04555.1 Hypothetical protein BOM_0012 [Borrelia miyamotoi FR64b]ATQ14439.1 hypothetical protein CNO14_00060 [Borrelia miyamotoi]ATQ15624.1 hypothetical protein CNO13_00060 [Borrelia miyamotoi]ATQ16769.1 hypothetical protein CNO12_00060 [Borrelia miyamotoi]ATQ18728.1 hypothetical protein CNO11_04190 [Borrelia miyamotoi]